MEQDKGLTLEQLRTLVQDLSDDYRELVVLVEDEYGQTSGIEDVVDANGPFLTVGRPFEELPVLREEIDLGEWFSRGSGGYSTRETYRQWADGRRAGDAADETAALIMSVPCPVCGAEPGAWCEYATSGRKGSFQDLHLPRMRAVRASRVERPHVMGCFLFNHQHDGDCVVPL